MGFGTAFGTLAGGAVAICGASAALAFATLLGDRRIDRAQVALVLVGVAAASALAMFLYPIISHLLAFSDQQAGFMLGASIHDVAQALGAGYAISNEAGETAAIIKLSRVALLAPALTIVALCLRANSARSRIGSMLPWFVVGFFAMAALSSTIAVPAVVLNWSSNIANGSLAAAVAATGIRSPMQELLRQGAGPLVIIVICSIFALVLAALAARFLVG
jgi:uncharacterized integral membrane protein (TIGR00698 family)